MESSYSSDIRRNCRVFKKGESGSNQMNKKRGKKERKKEKKKEKKKERERDK